MRLIIVSGRSGSGKTIALTSLEDLGFYCVDNLPVDLLPHLVEQLTPSQEKLAVSIDARNLPKDLTQLKTVVTQLKNTSPHHCEIIYLDAEDKVLLQRFSETRRRHPLTSQTLSLHEAIQQEHLLLTPLSHMADININTAYLSKHQLSSVIRDKVAHQPTTVLQLLLLSFGYKNGIPPEADFVFDARCLANPYWQKDLRTYTGLDGPVIHYLNNQPDVQSMINDIMSYLENWIPRFEHDNRSYLTVAIGCTGGQHRSVYITEALRKCAQQKYKVQLRHRDIAKS